MPPGTSSTWPQTHRLRVLVVLALLIVVGCVHGTTGAQSPPATITVTPAAIPLSDPELVNPMRGFYRWYGGEPVPQPEPARDHYARYGWRQLEPERGRYDFSAIEQAMEEARRSGAKFAFRVMAVNEFTSSVEIPAYLGTEAGGGWCTVEGQSVWVPAWDSPAFLARAQALVEALGARFNGDPRLGYYDMGLYGHWGEWHTTTLCTPAASAATKRALVDMQLAAFSRSRVLMNSGASEVDAFVYALGRSPRVGVRVDSLCDPWFDQQFTTSPTKLAAMRDRWQTAPVVAEFFSWNQSDLGQCDEQVRAWHVAGIANGRIEWERYGAEQQAALIQLGKHSGYRIVLNQLSYPSAVQTNTPFTVTSQWSNVGVTPAYEPAVVTFELRPKGEGRVIWTGRSQLDLERLLPTSTPQAVSDTLRLLGRIPAGQYTLSLVVRDPTGYRPPLAIAIAGGDAAGRYVLGEIIVEPGPPANELLLPLLRGR
jgi:hypothetical protein